MTRVTCSQPQPITGVAGSCDVLFGQAWPRGHPGAKLRRGARERKEAPGCSRHPPLPPIWLPLRWGPIQCFPVAICCPVIPFSSLLANCYMYASPASPVRLQTTSWVGVRVRLLMNTPFCCYLGWQVTCLSLPGLSFFICRMGI